MRQILALCLVVLLSAAGIAHAQDKVADPDYAKKVELAKEMHKIRPAKAQVQEAVEQVSRNLGPADRDKFNRMVQKAFDYDKLEKLSSQTMVDLFTVAELQKMVDYFGSPEAKAISQKLPKYQEKIQPEIIRQLDAAMLAERTGGEATPPVVNKGEKPAEKASEKAPAAPSLTVPESAKATP
jgi:adenylosuccinate synthase